MTFGFGRPEAQKPAVSVQAQNDAEAMLEQTRLVAALDAIKRGATAEWPAGAAGEALKGFAAELDRRGRQDLETIVNFAGEAAATGAGVCWVTHDVRQVADSTSAIAGAVTERPMAAAKMIQVLMVFSPLVE